MEIVDLFTQPNLYQLPEKFEPFKASGYYKGYYLMICLSYGPSNFTFAEGQD